uniref:Sushi domain-containing protein n=1 Tax=Steinernema glaseri TaxID=37863 RepID=A0A1I7Z3L9_9BILA
MLLHGGRSPLALSTFVVVFHGLLYPIDSTNYKLAELYSFVNSHSGMFRDHYATTWTQATHPEALSGYSLLDTFGMIGVQSDTTGSPEMANCSCLQEIVQLFDQQMGLGATPQNPGLFGKLDHKFARTGEETNMLFQKYERTGEKLYCVKNPNECGATVPLYQWYLPAEIDTIYTTRDVNDAAVNNLVSQGVLCYIWPNTYKEKNCTNPSPMLQTDSGPAGYGYSTEISSDEKAMKNCDLSSLQTAHGQWAMTKSEATPGTVAILNCDTGYVSTESPTVVVCQRSGDWMPPTGKCRMSGCEGPTNWKAEYGDITFSMDKIRNPTDNRELNIYPIGTTAMLVCDKTSDVIEREADIVYCSESGWAPRALGRCYKVCPEFNVTRGHVEYANSDGIGRVTKSNGTVATLICASGSKLVGSGTAECKNGEWDSEDIGTCEPVGCPPLAEVTDGNLEYASDGAGGGRLLTERLQFYESGTRVHLICENGTKVKGGHEAVCQCNEEWKPDIGHCA